jgi:predicted MFS family arabinose efflux permease
MARFGAPACLAVAAASTVGVVAATWLIRPPVSAARRPAPWRAAIGEGADYVRSDAFTFRLLALTAAVGLLVLPYQAFLPAFARDILNIGAQGLGVLLAAVGAGAVVGALVSGAPRVAARPGPSMAAFALVTGIGLAGFALATPASGVPAWVAVAALVAVGLGSIGYLTSANTTLQLRIPDALVGRVMGLWVVVNAGTTPLGSLALGGVAERYGLPAVVGGCGLVGMLLAALVFRAFAGTTLRATSTLRPAYR